MSTNNDDQLEQQFGDLIARLSASRPTNSPVPAELKSQVRNRILNYRPIQRRQLVPMSMALAVAVLVVGVFLWTVSPRPVSAAEIISRASQVATSGSPALQSYTGVEVFWLRSSYNLDNPLVDWPLAPNSEIYVWAKLPNLVRQQWYGLVSASKTVQTATSVPDATSTAPNEDVDLSNVPAVGVQNLLIINDGSTVWWQEPFAKTITHWPPAITQVQPLSNSYKALLKQLEAQNDNVKLIGTETVAGREAYVLIFTPKPGQQVWADTTQIKIWIDTQTYFLLQQKSLDKNGVILEGWAYTQFSPNVDIPAERFTFTPDPTYTVIDRGTPKDAADLDLAWQTTASKAAFKVFRPVNVPASLIMTRPFYYPDDNGSSPNVEQLIYSQDSSLLITLILSPTLFIMENAQQPGTIFRAAFGTSIKIDQYDGEYYEESGRRSVRFVRDGTEIFVQSSQQVMSKEELLDLARTLQSVSKEQ